MSTRIDKYLANNGYCSRRKVADYLKSHQVSVNQKRVFEPGVRFNSSEDNLQIDGQTVQAVEYVYYVVNKPLGYVSTVSDEMGRKTVLDLLPKDIINRYRLYPVGRLDRDSHGLVLLTNDGDLAYHITHPKHHIAKTYHLQIQGRLKPRYLQLMEQGIQLKDGKTAPAQIQKHTVENNVTTLELTLFEGRNRQIRRMCKALNLELIDLKRVAIGELSLDSLTEGQCRQVDREEIGY